MTIDDKGSSLNLYSPFIQAFVREAFTSDNEIDPLSLSAKAHWLGFINIRPWVAELIESLQHNPAAQKRNHAIRLVFISLHIEGRTQYRYILFIQFYNERFFFIFSHLEISFAIQVNLPVFPIETGRILERRCSIQYDFCSIRKDYRIGTPSFPNMYLVIYYIFFRQVRRILPFHKMHEFPNLIRQPV